MNEGRPSPPLPHGRVAATTPKVLEAIYRIRTVEPERIILTQVVAGTPMNVSGESDSNEWTIMECLETFFNAFGAWNV